jgi:hypothetical protein
MRFLPPAQPISPSFSGWRQVFPMYLPLFGPLAPPQAGQAGAFAQRNTAETKLRSRLRGLIGELEHKMVPLDERWLAFGLNRPGAEDPPSAPVNTTATPMGGGKVFVKCDRVPRTDYYQIWIQVAAVDENFRRADSPDGPEKMLEGLPAGATVKIKMRAVNEAAQGRLATR